MGLRLRQLSHSPPVGAVAAPWSLPRWLPNALSLLRIAMVPLWLALALTERHRWLTFGEVHRLTIVLLLLLIGATDVLDGLLARRFGLSTNLGATLDAVADKLATVVAVTFLTFAGAAAFGQLPVWLWVLLIVRDAVLGIGLIIIWRRHRAVRVEHRWHGRVATLTLFATVLAACAGAPYAFLWLGSAVVVALSVPGTIDYAREGARQLKRGPAPVA